MKHSTLAAVVLAAVASVAPTAVSATCGSGQQIDYDDITSVLVTNDYRVSDGYRDKAYPVSDISRSTYWLHLWDAGGTRFPTAYSQWTLVGNEGSFHVGATLAEARAILKDADFFTLSPPDYTLATEQTFSVVTVRRCTVVTRVIIDNNPDYQDARSKKLLRDFDALIMHSSKTKMSAAPQNFQASLLFDP